jgi:outer membrane protein assembly factor BamB
LRSVAALLAALLASCGPRASDLVLKAGAPRRLEPLETLSARLSLELAPAPFAGVVAASASGLTGSALEREESARRPWQHEAVIAEPPLLARRLVVFGEGPRLVALDVATGASLWSIARGAAHLEALADDGTLSALVLSSARRDQRWLTVVDRSGRERLHSAAVPELGAAALVAGTLLVPWGGHLLSTVDVGSGSELTRSTVDSALHDALWIGRELFVAGPPWWRLGRAPGVAQALPPRPLPGHPQIGAGSIAASEDPELTRLFVKPAPEGSEPAPFLASYGRLVLSFEGSRGSLQWLRVLPGAVLGALAADGSYAICDSTGTVRMLSADGSRSLVALRLSRARRDESALSSCALGAGVSWPRVETAAQAAPPEPLIDQLAHVLALSDSDLANAQRFLARELAARPEPDATRALIALAARRSADPILQSEAEDLLATRRNGQEYMLQALERAGPRSADPVSRAPIGALADALLALGEKKAAPLLAAQMNQLGHSPQELERVARALEKLATDAEYAPLVVFFSVYRTSADQPELEEAVSAVGRTLLRVGAAPGRRLVEIATRDPLTVPGVRSQLEKALQP